MSSSDGESSPELERITKRRFHDDSDESEGESSHQPMLKTENKNLKSVTKIKKNKTASPKSRNTVMKANLEREQSRKIHSKNIKRMGVCKEGSESDSNSDEDGSSSIDGSDSDNTRDQKEESDGGKQPLKTDQTSNQGESEEDGFAKIRKELSTMPFDERQKLKEKIGLKLYNQVMSGTVCAGSQQRFKRENKNRPMEVSSKVRPPRMRHVVPVKKQLVRDPRFDDLSGEYKEDIFKKTYSFLDDIKQHEKEKLLKELKTEKDEEKKAQVEYLVHRMAAQEKQEQHRQRELERKHERRKREKQLILDGKKPFYLKSSEKKKLDLAERYRALKQKGKVDQYLSKKRKKNATKERRNLPATE